MQNTLTLCRRAAGATLGALALTGCAGPSSALDPAGRGAERIASLFWWMTGGVLAVWLVVVGITLYATYLSPGGASMGAARRLVIAGGVVVPTVLLTVLLAYGLALIPPLLAAPPPGRLTIAITGEQWWWRVRYLAPDGAPVDLANELHLAVGEPVELRLDSHDVIHSLWIPALAGKMDMIPGRTTRLTLEPTRAGVFHGLCAEYCGASHAFMAFTVVVSEPEEFRRWLAQQAEPAAPPADSTAKRGQELFLADGCGACHSVRGTPANGVVGPDLTHVGSRRTIGAGRLPNEIDAVHQWLARPGELKPSVTMPAFGMLPEDDLRGLAAYLRGLK
jgi:cytochrome c oxidase subunit 2